jgi:hypothetical protein
MEDFSQDSLRPFDRFLDEPTLNMLHSALPYVGGTLRKPLALYIKLLEMNRILTDFDREDVLSACGFEDNSPNLEQMLKAIKAAGGKNAGPQIDSALNLIQFFRMYQSCMELMNNNPELMGLINNLMNQNSQPAAQTTDSPDLMGVLSELLKKQEL